MANAISAAHAAKLAHDLRDTGAANVTAAELGEVTIGPDDVIISETPREGWAVESANGESIALDLEIDDELRRAGLARDVIRAIQEARKVSGLDVSDRISLWWQSDDPELVLMWNEHGHDVCREVLAIACEQGQPNSSAHEVETELPMSIALLKHTG